MVKPAKKARPAQLTQEQVDGLSSGGKTAGSARRLLRAASSSPRPATAPAKAVSPKAAPPPVSRREMAAIREGGRFPRSVRERISVPSPESPEVSGYPGEEKLVPSVAPQVKKAAR